MAATATTSRVMQEGPNTQTSSIVPVWVSSTELPDEEVLVYALLDTQSDTFILDEVAQDLDTRNEIVSLWLSTMFSRSMVINWSETKKPSSEKIQLKKKDSIASTLYTRVHSSRQCAHSNF